METFEEQPWPPTEEKGRDGGETRESESTDGRKATTRMRLRETDNDEVDTRNEGRESVTGLWAGMKNRRERDIDKLPNDPAKLKQKLKEVTAELLQAQEEVQSVKKQITRISASNCEDGTLNI